MIEEYKNIDEAISTLIDTMEVNPEGVSVMKINVARYLYEKKNPSDNRPFKEFLKIVEDRYNQKVNLN